MRDSLQRHHLSGAVAALLLKKSKVVADDEATLFSDDEIPDLVAPESATSFLTADTLHQSSSAEDSGDLLITPEVPEQSSDGLKEALKRHNLWVSVASLLLASASIEAKKAKLASRKNTAAAKRSQSNDVQVVHKKEHHPQSSSVPTSPSSVASRRQSLLLKDGSSKTTMPNRSSTRVSTRSSSICMDVEEMIPFDNESLLQIRIDRIKRKILETELRTKEKIGYLEQDVKLQQASVSLVS
jgi:hypothetical protein